jgi:hypothetical protein
MLKRSLFLAAALTAALTAATPAQNVVKPGDVGIVTTDGFLFQDTVLPGLPVSHYVSPAALGLNDMPNPGITWEFGTDSFLVCSADRLVRVTLGTTTTVQTDLTPSLAPGAVLSDIDLHPGTGQLVLLDTGNAEALFYDPPFAPGMTPAHTLALNPTTRSLAFDSYAYPPSLVHSRGGKVERITLDGVTTPLSELKLCDGVDKTPQSSGGIYITKQATNQVVLSGGNPLVVQNLNIVGLCSPVALGPRSIAYRPVKTWTYVLAQDGLNPGCYPGVFGPNHIVSFPPALGPFLPEVITQTFGSGITGTDGDITAVTDDFAFGSPYGPSCVASWGNKPKLLNDGTLPVPGTAAFTMKVTKGAPFAPVFLWVGLAPADIPLLSGCSVLVQPLMSFLAGTTDVDGKLIITAGIPASIPLGVELWLQAGLPDVGSPILTNGLMLHMGLE